MSNAIPPVGSGSSIPEVPDEDQTIPHKQRQQLQDIVGDLQGAIQQINTAQANNQPISDNTVSLLDSTASKLQGVIPHVHSKDAQNSLSSALETIQVVVANPDAQVNPAGQVTGATMTITEVIQQ